MENRKTLRRALRRLPLLALLGALGLPGPLGCYFGEFDFDDPLGRKFHFGERQKRYTDFVRWSAFEHASEFVDPELHDEFVNQFPSFRKLRFTDYEVKYGSYDEERTKRTVTVTYFAYQTMSPYEIEIGETQEWYREDDTNRWLVRPSFEGWDELAFNEH